MKECPVLLMVVITEEGGEGRKQLRVDFFLVSLHFLPGVSRFGCGLRACGSMRVSIARILSSISDKHYAGMMDQWDVGEGWRQQKQESDEI